MRNYLVVFAFCLINLMSCTGPQGPVGPAGSSVTSIFIGGDNQTINLTSNLTIVRQVSMTVSSPGVIIYQASGFFYYNYNTIDYVGRVSWSLNTDSIDFAYACIIEGNSSVSYNPYTVTRGLTVNSPGTYTAYLLSQLTIGSGIQMLKNNVTATFTPR
jgi:hypothetical protein